MLPLDTNGAINVASALANSCGYSAVRRLKEPSAIRMPEICWCVRNSCGHDLATAKISGWLATNIQVLAQSFPNWHADACATKGATAWIHWTIRGSSKVMDVAGFSKMTNPPCWSTSDSKALERSWIAALSSTASCCCGAAHRWSQGYRVRTGAGPGDFKVALLCLLQYGAANAAPISPEAASRKTSSNVSSCKRSCPWIRSIGWTRSPKNSDNAVLTGMDAPAKMSKKNFVGGAIEKSFRKRCLRDTGSGTVTSKHSWLGNGKWIWSVWSASFCGWSELAFPGNVGQCGADLWRAAVECFTFWHQTQVLHKVFHLRLIVDAMGKQCHRNIPRVDDMFDLNWGHLAIHHESPERHWVIEGH